MVVLLSYHMIDGFWIEYVLIFLAFEGDSNVVYFEGGYSDYEENRKKD